MINPQAKLNSKLFDKDVEQLPIRKGWNANAWSIPKPERVGARRGRGIFQQKNIRDLVKGNLLQIPC
jgi:hypothetical protein